MAPSARHAGYYVCLAALALILLGGSRAVADIYHYIDDDGNHLFTTYRVRGLELVEVLRSESQSSRSESRRSGSRASRPRASC